MFSFDLADPLVFLRIMCGAFFVPHVIGKFTHRETTFGFFSAAGLRPTILWVYMAMAIESAVALCLILGAFIPFAAATAAVFLFVAAGATLKVSKGRWLWNMGGAEYPLFWGLCCALLAAFHAIADYGAADSAGF
jgi:putative oxidoreductase